MLNKGHEISIRLVGVGYKAALEDDKLILKLGFSHPVILTVPEGINVSLPLPNRIVFRGCNLQKITLFAANIRKLRKPEPYNGKGIFVGDETIKLKEGKKK